MPPKSNVGTFPGHLGFRGITDWKRSRDGNDWVKPNVPPNIESGWIASRDLAGKEQRQYRTLGTMTDQIFDMGERNRLDDTILAMSNLMGDDYSKLLLDAGDAAATMRNAVGEYVSRLAAEVDQEHKFVERTLASFGIEGIWSVRDVMADTSKVADLIQDESVGGLDKSWVLDLRDGLLAAAWKQISLVGTVWIYLWMVKGAVEVVHCEMKEVYDPCSHNPCSMKDSMLVALPWYGNEQGELTQYPIPTIQQIPLDKKIMMDVTARKIKSQIAVLKELVTIPDFCFKFAPATANELMEELREVVSYIEDAELLMPTYTPYVQLTDGYVSVNASDAGGSEESKIHSMMMLVYKVTAFVFESLVDKEITSGEIGTINAYVRELREKIGTINLTGNEKRGEIYRKLKACQASLSTYGLKEAVNMLQDAIDVFIDDLDPLRIQ